jgi:hypothetical protein
MRCTEGLGRAETAPAGARMTLNAIVIVSNVRVTYPAFLS